MVIFFEVTDCASILLVVAYGVLVSVLSEREMVGDVKHPYHVGNGVSVFQEEKRSEDVHEEESVTLV